MPTTASTESKSALPQTSGRKRRRVPVLAIAVLGAAVAVVYGALVLRMRAGPPLVMLGLGGLTLVLGAAALWRVIDPLTRGELTADSVQRAPHRLRELEREKQVVLKAIKEIELDFQMRKISEPDYRDMVERYRARALRVLGDLAAGDDYRALIERELKDRLAARAVAAATGGDSAAKTVTPAGAAAACGACGAANDSDAQFCKKCGQPLVSSSAAPA